MTISNARIQRSQHSGGHDESDASEFVARMDLADTSVIRGRGSLIRKECTSGREYLLIPLEPMTLEIMNKKGGVVQRLIQAYSVSWFASGQLQCSRRSDDKELLLVTIDPDCFGTTCRRIDTNYERPDQPIVNTVHADIPLLGAAIARLLSAVDGSHVIFLPPMLDWLILRYVCELNIPEPNASPVALDDVELHKTLLEIEGRLPDTVPIAELAVSLGMSPSRYSRAFKASVGYPPSRYVLERRVAQAQRLLETTDMALVDVTLESGFSSQSHMTFVFVKELGVTPGQYRRSCKSQVS